MARLNTRPSIIQSERQSTTTPGPAASDQENQDPTTDRSNKSNHMPASSSRLHPDMAGLLSNRNGNNSRRGSKRRRTDVTEPPDGQYSDEEEERFNRYFDPNQDPERRREIKRRSRILDREFQENRDELLRSRGHGLRDTVQRANTIFREVKQTGDATLDSRLLVNVSELGFKKSAQLVLGDNSSGIDVDEFLTKCITYMTNGGPLGRMEQNTNSHSARMGTQAHRRPTQTANDDSDAEPDEFAEVNLDWEFLGRNACFPYNARPPVPSFLLGPLSLERRVRTQTQRRARQTRDRGGVESRPENIGREDIQQSDENGLTQICARIRKHLSHHCRQAEKHLERHGIQSVEELKTPRGKEILKRAKITDTGGPGLFEYVINPYSFGQTVENLFYVSFLIKEGHVGISPDSDGLPSLAVTNPHSLDDDNGVRHERQKQQAVFALDFDLWKQLIEAFNIKEPMIAHREEEQTTDPGVRGWYG